MIILKIDIENFRSYYKKNTIPFYISIFKKYEDMKKNVKNIIFFALDVKKIFDLIANLNILNIM